MCADLRKAYRWLMKIKPVYDIHRCICDLALDLTLVVALDLSRPF